MSIVIKWKKWQRSFWNGLKYLFLLLSLLFFAYVQSLGGLMGLRTIFNTLLVCTQMHNCIVCGFRNEKNQEKLKSRDVDPVCWNNCAMLVLQISVRWFFFVTRIWNNFLNWNSWLLKCLWKRIPFHHPPSSEILLSKRYGAFGTRSFFSLTFFSHEIIFHVSVQINSMKFGSYCVFAANREKTSEVI